MVTSSFQRNEPKKKDLVHPGLILAIASSLLLVGCMSAKTCDGHLREAISVFTGSQIYSISQDLKILEHLKYEPGNQNINSVKMLVKQQISTNLLLISSAHVDVRSLSDINIETLCLVKSKWSDVAYDMTKESTDVRAHAFIESISVPLLSELKDRQSRLGGSGCEVGGVDSKNPPRLLN